MRTNGSWAMHPSMLRVCCPHCQHRLHEKTASSLIADLSHATDFVPMRQIDISGILHQQGDLRGVGLFSGLLQVWLHQGGKGDIWFIKQTIQGFYPFPGVHLGWQRSQRILCHTCGRFDRASRSAHIVQLDTSKGLLGPAFGVQHFLRIHL